MEDTGLITAYLQDDLADIVYGGNVSEAAISKLQLMTEVDLSHVVMLAEEGIIQPFVASRIIDEIFSLRKVKFEPLIGRKQPRGLYMVLEDHLRSRLGDEIGGALQTGRSRNDLNATVSLLEVGRYVSTIVKSTSRTIKTISNAAHKHFDVIFPALTHYQAAFPITLGHYLHGVSHAMAHNLTHLVNRSEDLDRCPLGACAGGGTSFAIQPSRTAELLGFSSVTSNSVEAVASRDYLLRFLSDLSIHATSLSRLAHDLSLWSSSEFQFVSFPDDLVGSSSIMPQKRNPFLLEHIKGEAASCLAALTGSTVAMHNTPFSNSIAVGTNAFADVSSAVNSILKANKITAAMIQGLQPNTENLARRTLERHTTATVAAEIMVREEKVSFRQAHHAIGTAIRTGSPVHGLPNPDEAIALLRFGGGPVQGREPDTIAHDILCQVYRVLRDRSSRRARGKFLRNTMISSLTQCNHHQKDENSSVIQH